MMADGITTQEFYNHFAYTLNGFQQDLCDFSDTCIYLILGLSFFIYIISLKMV